MEPFISDKHQQNGAAWSQGLWSGAHWHLMEIYQDQGIENTIQKKVQNGVLSNNGDLFTGVT